MFAALIRVMVLFLVFSTSPSAEASEVATVSADYLLESESRPAPLVVDERWMAFEKARKNFILGRGVGLVGISTMAFGFLYPTLRDGSYSSDLTVAASLGATGALTGAVGAVIGFVALHEERRQLRTPVAQTRTIAAASMLGAAALVPAGSPLLAAVSLASAESQHRRHVAAMAVEREGTEAPDVAETRPESDTADAPFDILVDEGAAGSGGVTSAEDVANSSAAAAANRASSIMPRVRQGHSLVQTGRTVGWSGAVGSVGFGSLLLAGVDNDEALLLVGLLGCLVSVPMLVVGGGAGLIGVRMENRAAQALLEERIAAGKVTAATALFLAGVATVTPLARVATTTPGVVVAIGVPTALVGASYVVAAMATHDVRTTLGRRGFQVRLAPNGIVGRF